MTFDADVSTDVVAALRIGDEDVFGRLVADLTPGLTRLARMYVSLALAEEVVQETWAAVITSIDRFEGRSTLQTWIYRILLNKVRTLGAREAKIVPFAALGSSGDGESGSVDADRLMRDGAPGRWTPAPPEWQRLPADQLEADETLEMIREAIERLPPAQREVVELRDVHGLTSDEGWNTLGLSAVKQRVLLHRGRTALRRIPEEYLTT